MLQKVHWETVYETKPTDSVSWYEEAPTQSLALLTRAGLGVGSAVVDVGGGASPLPAALLALGVHQLTVVDISCAALAKAQGDLGALAASVTWIEADVTTLVLPPASVDLWHDRAVFHFLTDDADRARYVSVAARSVKTGGACVIGTFAPDGPSRCSGLAVAQYSPESLAAAFGDAFRLEHGAAHTHVTPSGTAQRFSWVILSRR